MKADDKQARRSTIMLDTIVDANNGFPELRKRNPKLYAEITAQQQAVADCRRRAATNRDLLDMRLD